MDMVKTSSDATTPSVSEPRTSTDSQQSVSIDSVITASSSKIDLEYSSETSFSIIDTEDDTSGNEDTSPSEASGPLSPPELPEVSVGKSTEKPPCCSLCEGGIPVAPVYCSVALPTPVVCCSATYDHPCALSCCSESDGFQNRPWCCTDPASVTGPNNTPSNVYPYVSVPWSSLNLPSTAKSSFSPTSPASDFGCTGCNDTLMRDLSCTSYASSTLENTLQFIHHTYRQSTADLCTNLSSITMREKTSKDSPLLHRVVKSLPKGSYKKENDNLSYSPPMVFVKQNSQPKIFNKISPHHLLPFIASSYLAKRNYNRQKEKSKLLQQLAKIDNEILDTEQKIRVLKNQVNIIDSGSNKEDSSAYPRVINYSICKSFENIYLENNRKAKESHEALLKFASIKETFIGIQPTEISLLKETKNKFERFKPLLIKYLRKKRNDEIEARNREKVLYNLRNKRWQQMIKDLEDSESWIKGETEKIDYFESVFPELKADRETREILRRETVRTRSNPLQRDVTWYMKEKQMGNPKTAAVIPPLLTREQRRRFFINNNGFVHNFESLYKLEKTLKQVKWTDSDKEIFKEKFVEWPKMFGLISSQLNNKSVNDCVYQYYASKKCEHYKQLVLLKEGRRLRTRQQRMRLTECSSGSDNQPAPAVKHSESLNDIE